MAWMYYVVMLLNWWFLWSFRRVDLSKFLTNRSIAKHVNVRVCVLFSCIPSFCLFSLLLLQMHFYFLICFFIFLILYFLFVPSWLGGYFVVWLYYYLSNWVVGRVTTAGEKLISFWTLSFTSSVFLSSM